MIVFRNKIEQKHKTCGPVRVEIKKLKAFGKIVAMTGFSQILHSLLPCPYSLRLLKNIELHEYFPLSVELEGA